MRSLSRAALVLAAMFIAAPALHAQASFGIAAGATVPMGDAADSYKMGYHATLSLGIKPPLAPIGFRAEGMFNSLDVDGADASLRLMGLTANGTYTLLPQIYLIGGVGMYNSKLSVSSSDAENDFGFNLGAGVNIPLTGFGTYIEARYHHIPVEDASFQFIPISVGIRF
jgi:Outer membrane protein beta-barrel domain